MNNSREARRQTQCLFNTEGGGVGGGGGRDATLFHKAHML